MKKVTTTATAAAWNAKQVAVIEALAGEQKSGKIDNVLVKTLLTHEEFVGKNAAMIRGKSTSLGVYQAADPNASKAVNGTVERKSDLVSTLENLMNLESGSLSSFEKGAKPQLETACKALVKMYEAEETK